MGCLNHKKNQHHPCLAVIRWKRPLQRGLYTILWVVLVYIYIYVYIYIFILYIYFRVEAIATSLSAAQMDQSRCRIMVALNTGQTVSDRQVRLLIEMSVSFQYPQNISRILIRTMDTVYQIWIHWAYNCVRRMQTRSWNKLPLSIGGITYY